ncbi:hypothetical protein EXIGLDRAFT_593497, partial [Exidia glandulosa HHB12029]
APDPAAQELFRRFKALCVPLLANSDLKPNTSDKASALLTALADELESVPEETRPLKSSLISYVFFPVSTLLRRNDLVAIPPRVLEAVLRVLASLAEHWWWSADAQTWEQLFKLVAFVLVGVDPKGKERAHDEHTQLAAVRALYAIIGGRATSKEDSAERLEMYRDHLQVQVLGKTLDALLSLCPSPNSELGLSALRTTAVLVRDFMPDDLAPSIMPGVVSVMLRCSLGEGTRKGWANGDHVTASLDVLSWMVVKGIGDDVCVAAGAVKRVEDLQDLASLVSDAAEEDESAHQPGALTRRTRAWLRGTATQLHIALNSLTHLIAHSNATAQRALVSMSSTILQATTLTLPQSHHLLLSFLLALARSEYTSVSSAAHVALAQAAREPALLQHVLTLARDALSELTRLIRSRSDAKLAHRLRQVLAVCALAEDVPAIRVGMGRLLGPGGGIEKWGLGLLGALQFAPPTQAGIVSEATTFLLEESTQPADDDVAFVPLKLKSPADGDVQALLEDTLRELGHAGSLEGLFAVEWLVGLGVRELSARASSALWCASLMAEGVALAGHDLQSTSKLFKTARWMAKAVAELWQQREEDQLPEDPQAQEDNEPDRPQIEFVSGLVKIDTSKMFPTPQLAQQDLPRWSPEVHRAAALRVIAASSMALQAAFAPLLLHTLYPILHALVSPSAVLRSTATTTLHRVARASGFATPRNLLMANFDYALAGAASRLLRAQLDVDAASVLHILVRLVGGDVVDRMGDVVAECFERLDEYHGYEVLVERLVDVLGEVVRVVKDDVQAREPIAQRPAETVSSAEERPDLFRPWSMGQLLTWLDKRHDTPPQPPVEEDDVGPTPHTAWRNRRDHEHNHTEEHEHEHNDEQPPPAQPQEEKPQPTATHKLVHLILSRSVPFLTHASPLIRARILRLLTSSVPILVPETVGEEHHPGVALLLPQVHRAWPFVLNRLSDSEPFVVAAAAGLVAELASSTGTGEFVRARVWEEVWPRFRTLLDALQRAESQSALAQRRYGQGGDAPSAYANSTRLHVAMLRTIDAALRGPGGALDIAVWEVALAFCRFLDKGEAEGVQHSAVSVFKALRAANEDAVWLALSASVG